LAKGAASFLLWCTTPHDSIAEYDPKKLLKAFKKVGADKRRRRSTD